MGLFSWYNLPQIAGLLKLNTFRNRMREDNLHDTEKLPPNRSLADAPPPTPHQKAARTADGAYNDLSLPRMGSAGMRFGRNFPLDQVIADESLLMFPTPRLISNKLMTRDSFIPATTLNVLAAAWIQFQVHDWFSHGNEPEDASPHVVPLPANDDWPHPQMKISRTQRDRTRPADDTTKPNSYQNTETHWWDGSQLYGSNAAIQQRIRSFVDGKLVLGADGLLPVDPVSNVDITGVNSNWWVGLSMLHTLFTMEHNAICDELKKANPTWSDEELFSHARLVNAAVMAKIHTVEWTPGILAHPTIETGMNNNWNRIRESEQEHHAAPFSMTEEFVSVYRMHPLMPDDFVFRSLSSGQVIEQRGLDKVANRHSREVMTSVSLVDLFYSFGVTNPGAITLHNYPKHLQSLKLNGEVKMDLAAVDILRDRERGVPRYNRFRELLEMDRIEKFEDLSDNQQWCEEAREVYGGDIDLVDAMVGMFAEPLIEGFGFSETAFRIFLLMASRRLQSDRFFTTDYNEATYTKAGLDWIEDATMTKVLLRHLPQLQPILKTVENAFAPWPSA
ncbi:MAG: peroxidase family protein, partial [Blastocatellia bacterium]